MIKKPENLAYCVKCKQGYHGIVFEIGTQPSGSKFSSIEQCKMMSSCDNPRVSGMSYRTDYNMSKLGLNLEAYAVCGQCQANDKVLILNLQYTTDEKSIQPAGNDILNMDCVEFVVTPTNVVNVLANIVTGCAIYLHFVYEADSDKAKYCGGCKAGFRAVSYWPYTDVTNKGNIYTHGNLARVASCEVIEFCEGFEWLNSCSKCKQGYVYQYNDTLKVVEFDKCIAKPESVGNCLAAHGTKCYLCESGYVLNDTGVCDNFGVPLCAHFDSNNYAGIGNKLSTGDNINTDMTSDWSIVQYYFSNGEGCLDCYDGYISTEVPIWGYWETHFYCVFSNILKEMEISNGVVLAAGLDFNCLNYGYDYQNNVSKCKVCKRGFVLGENGDCDPMRNQLLGCILNVQKTSNVCKKCESKFFLNGSTCFAKTTDNCEEYQVKSSIAITCRKCKPGFYLITASNQCLKGAVQGCKYYRPNNQFDCIDCEEAHILVENDLTQVIKHMKRWEFLGMIWKTKQPFWDFWVHVLFNNVQAISVNKRTACIRIKGTKCKTARLVSIENVSNDVELFGEDNARKNDGFRESFIQRGLLNTGKAILTREEIIYECLECYNYRWSTSTLTTDISAAYSLDLDTIWAKGESNAALSEIEKIFVRVKPDGYSATCSPIVKAKECLISDSGALDNLGKALVDFSGAMNIFGEDFLIKLSSGVPLMHLLSEYAQFDLKYEIENDPSYSVDLKDLHSLEDWLKKSSLNIYSDFGLFLSFFPSLRKMVTDSDPNSLLSSVNLLSKEAYSLYLGNDVQRALSKPGALSFFRTSISRSLWKCLYCNADMFSDNGVCKMRRNPVENCDELEPDSDGNCLRCRTGYILSTKKQCTFLSTSILANCIEFKGDTCRTCRFGYLLSETTGVCDKISSPSIVKNCYRQNTTQNCLQCRYGHRFNWKQICLPISDNGYCWDYNMDILDGCFSCQPLTFLFKASDTSIFCSPIKLDIFTGATAFEKKVDTFLADYVVDGFVEREYKLRKAQSRFLLVISYPL